jgi:hypothetical protein
MSNPATGDTLPNKIAIVKPSLSNDRMRCATKTNVHRQQRGHTLSHLGNLRTRRPAFTHILKRMERMRPHGNPINSLKTRRIFREPQGCFSSAQHSALVVINAESLRIGSPVDV